MNESPFEVTPGCVNFEDTLNSSLQRFADFVRSSVLGCTLSVQEGQKPAWALFARQTLETQEGSSPYCPLPGSHSESGSGREGPRGGPGGWSCNWSPLVRPSGLWPGPALGSWAVTRSSGSRILGSVSHLKGPLRNFIPRQLCVL